MAAAELTSEFHWVCPNCDSTDVTHRYPGQGPHTRMHNCRGLLGMSVPMVEDGVRCKVELIEREDYTHGDDVQTAPEDGRVYSHAVTTREDGNDVVAYAPTAVAWKGIDF